MSLAIVAKVLGIEPHPDPEITRLEVLRISTKRAGPTHPWPPGQQVLVTGKHYRVGQLGIWIRPNAWIPGWLAMELWLVGKKRSKSWFQVREIEIKGVPSPGLFCGQVYMKDGTEASATRYMEMAAHGGAVQFQSGQPDHSEFETGWIEWPYWRPEWQVGDVLDDYLGVLAYDPSFGSADLPNP